MYTPSIATAYYSDNLANGSTTSWLVPVRSSGRQLSVEEKEWLTSLAAFRDRLRESDFSAPESADGFIELSEQLLSILAVVDNLLTREVQLANTDISRLEALHQRNLIGEGSLPLTGAAITEVVDCRNALLDTMNEFEKAIKLEINERSADITALKRLLESTESDSGYTTEEQTTLHASVKRLEAELEVLRALQQSNVFQSPRREVRFYDSERFRSPFENPAAYPSYTPSLEGDAFNDSDGPSPDSASNSNR